MATANSDSIEAQRDDHHLDHPNHGVALDEDAIARRSRRARTERMEVSLLERGGRYEVQSESGRVYQVDVLDGTCTCPDSVRAAPSGGCKHLRRVELEIRGCRVPRPDGKIPGTSDGGTLIKAKVLSEIVDREEQLLEIDAELEVLDFVFEILENATLDPPD